MSIYQAPLQHNGSLNSTFNSTDYAQTANKSGISSADTGSRYLKNSGIVVSSAATTFNNSITIAGQTNVSNLSVSALLNAKQATDTLVSATFSAAQTFSFNGGMVYTLISNSTTTTTLAITDLPTTPQQSYIFTFIIQPSATNIGLSRTQILSVQTAFPPLCMDCRT